MPLHRRRGITWAFAAAILAAAFLVPWKVASRHGTPATAVLVLLVAAALVNTLLWPLTWRLLSTSGFTPQRERRTELLLSLGLALLTLLGNWASAEAVSRLSPSVLSVLQRSEMLVVALTAWIWLGERVDVKFWLGAGLAVVGLVLVQGVDSSVTHTSGVLLGVASAVCFALMSVLVRRNIEHIDPTFVNMWRLWLSVGFWFAFERRLPTRGELNVELLGYGALAALFGPSLSRLCLMYSARHVEARYTSLTTLLVPLFTLALAFLLLGDVPDVHQLGGSALMLVGIGLPILASRARAESSAAQNKRSSVAT